MREVIDYDHNKVCVTFGCFPHIHLGLVVIEAARQVAKFEKRVGYE